MSALITGKVLESGSILTPKGRLIVFNNSLFEPQLPRGETDKAKAKFQATLLLPADADLTILKKAVADCAKAEFSEKQRKGLKSPFLKTEDQERYVEYADDYPALIRCSANYKPDVVNQSSTGNIDEEDAPDEVYSGRWARFSVRVYAWDHPTGGRGISLGLNNVQVLDNDEAIAGGKVKGLSEFGSADGDGGLADLEDDETSDNEEGMFE